METDISSVVNRFFEKRHYSNITELCHLMKKKDCDKGLGFHNYSTFYEMLFSPMRNKEFTLLEIGYNKNGVSLPVWREYFPKARIVGADHVNIQNNEGVETHIFDQKSAQDVHRFLKSIGGVDVIIDDGIHVFHDNWNLFTHAFPYLNEGGLYIIEDLKSETRDEFQKRRQDFLSRPDVQSFELVEIPYVNNNFDNRLVIIQKTRKPELTIVTAASQNHSKSLVQFLCSLIVNKVSFREVFVYDLGLDPSTLRIIKDMFPEQKVRIRTFDYYKYPSYFNIKEESGQYAWKPVIIEEVAQEIKTGFLLWCDAGNKIVDDLQPFCDFLRTSRIYTPTSIGTIKQWTHPRTLEYFMINDADSITTQPMRNAAQVGFNLNADVLYFIEEWSQCAQLKECIAPEGSHRKNHRQDQSILSILFYRFVKQHPNLVPVIRDEYFVNIHQDID